MRFLYTDKLEDGTDDIYRSSLSMRLVNFRSKHVMDVSSNKAKRLFSASDDIGYSHVVWGWGEGLSVQLERNRIVQLSRIQRFIYDGMVRPMRCVMDEKGIIWIDNLHTSIVHIFCRGMDAMLMQVPHYLIDMRNRDCLRIVDRDHLVNLHNVKDLLQVSEERVERVSDEIRDVYYTIGEFLSDNDLDRSCLTLPLSCYDDYVRKADSILAGIVRSDKE